MDWITRFRRTQEVSVLRSSARLLACLLAFISFASAGETVAPPAAVVRIPVPPHARVDAGVSVDPFDARLNVLLFGQLTGATNADAADGLTVWDYATQTRVDAFRASGGAPGLIDGAWYSSLSDATLASAQLSWGRGFEISSRHDATQEVWLAGQLPGDDSATLLAPAERSLLAPPYPVTLSFPQDSPPGGILAADVLRVWSPADCLDRLFLPVDDAGVLRFASQTPVGDDGIIDRGQGFWYDRSDADALLWSFSRPYAWPFAENIPPRIINAVSAPASGEILLTVVSASSSSTFNLFRKILASGQAFSSASWSTAAINVPVASSGTNTVVDVPPPRIGNTPDMLAYLVTSGPFTGALPNPDGSLRAEASVDSSSSGTTATTRNTTDTTASSAQGSTTAASTGTSSTKNLDGTTLVGRSSGSGTNADRLALADLPVSSGSIVYVDRTQGWDGFTGRRPVATLDDGPTRTIEAGVNATRVRDRLVIHRGAYTESLDLRGQAVDARVDGTVVLARDKTTPAAALAAVSRRSMESSVGPTGAVAQVTE